MWKCQKCGEELEGTFDRCWSCGTEKDGSPPEEPAGYQPPQAARGAAYQSVQQAVSVGRGPAINLLPNEKLLFESSGKTLVLTTHRVRYDAQRVGSSEITSIMLDELASCAMTRSSNVVLLVLAVLCFLGGIIAWGNNTSSQAFVAGVVVGLIFIVAYIASRRQVLALASAGETSAAW